VIAASTESKFPFLIGTVRTITVVVRLFKRLAFPFLIGTVRTEGAFGLVWKADGFPFLIGTVRTYNLLNYDEFDNNVSIPHRYGKNEKDERDNKEGE